MSSITGVKLLNNCSRSINSYIFTENGFYNCTGSYNIYIAGDSRNVTVSRCNLHDGDGAIDLEGKNLSNTRYCFCPSNQSLFLSHAMNGCFYPMPPIVVSIPCSEWLLLSHGVIGYFCPMQWYLAFFHSMNGWFFPKIWMVIFVPCSECFCLLFN